MSETQHYRVNSTYTTPTVVTAANFHELLDKLKVMFGASQPREVTIEFLTDGDALLDRTAKS